MGSDLTDRNVPTTVGIIMDGNRRFAKARGEAVWRGHAAGKQKLQELLRWAKEAGVTNLICYAFSTENWSRPPEEVAEIERLLVEGLTSEVDTLAKEGIRIRCIGDRTKFSSEVQTLLARAEEKTATGAHTLAIALSYGGRAEIAAAAASAAREGVVTEEAIAARLYTADLPDPELIIRTGGQRRLSNFLLWQAAYSELYFIDTLWPDFTKEEFFGALEWYAALKRNFGK